MNGPSNTRAVMRGSWDRVCVVLALIVFGVMLDRCAATQPVTTYSQDYPHWEARQ